MISARAAGVQASERASERSLVRGLNSHEREGSYTETCMRFALKLPIISLRNFNARLIHKSHGNEMHTLDPSRKLRRKNFIPRLT